LYTNPDSRLPFENQTAESKRVKLAYDHFDSDLFDGPFRQTYRY
jgi:hypothetical protein